MAWEGEGARQRKEHSGCRNELQNENGAICHHFQCRGKRFTNAKQRDAIEGPAPDGTLKASHRSAAARAEEEHRRRRNQTSILKPSALRNLTRVPARRSQEAAKT